MSQVMKFPKGLEPGSSVEFDCVVSELQRRALVEAIEQALVEMEESDEISQGAIDGLVDGLAMLGVTYESNDRRSSPASES